MKYCNDGLAKHKLEWTLHNICDSQDKETSNQEISIKDNQFSIGDTDAVFLESDCYEIDKLEPGECINEVSFYTTSDLPMGLRYETNEG